VNSLFLPGPGENIILENEEAIQERGELIDLAKEILAPLRKK
jgi:hypothetical protein